MTALIILGMHRSGTSLVAQACAAAGIGAGPDAEMLAAQADNPAGFYEHRDLVATNDRLLAAAGGAWADPPAPGATQALPAAGRALLEALANWGSGQFLLKDPRLCLTWPAWQPALEASLLLYVYRDALSVARSLQTRNGFPLQLGLLLWEDYNRRALDCLREAGGLALGYDAMLAEPQVLVTCLERVRDSGFRCDPAAAASVVDVALRHSTMHEGDPDWALLSDEQRALAALCESVAAGRAPPVVPRMQAAARARLHDLAAALTPLATLRETELRKEEALALCAERTGERDRALEQLKTLEGEHLALTSAHKREVAQHARAAATLANLESEHERLAIAHREEVAEREALAAKYSEVRDKASYLFDTLTAAYGGLLTFENSTMAGLQRQLRRVYRLLTRQRGRNSRYEDVLDMAHAHFDEFELAKPQAPPGRLDLLMDVLRYVWRNPVGSLRSFSWHRLRRALGVFFGASNKDLAVWVAARFPDSRARRVQFDPGNLDPQLDALELDFACPDEPEVSIVIPVFNDYRVTANCLRALHAHRGEVSFEVIIADDCSTDLTATIGERMHGVRVSRTAENLRFLRNCNQAAQLARGEFLVFLNNDTEVTGGWLDSLREVFEDPAVGVAGPRLLFGDGSLQEAGGIVWRDGSAWNFGRGDDPDKPAFNYRREVDYVSGACLMLRRSLWEGLGGFDTRFAPAYYEDADLCFAARDAGFAVVYQPESVVYHFEGVSNGTDLDAGVKQHQVTNQQVFRDKWAGVLDEAHYPNGEHVIWARDRSGGRPRVLVIDHYVPHYDRDAGGRSTFQYLRLLIDMGCQVQFLGANFFPHQPYTRRLQAMGVEVLTGEFMARTLDDWLRDNAAYIDEIFLHRPHVAEQFLPHLDKLDPRPPVNFFGHDLHYLRMQREAALNDSEELRRQARAWQRRELRVCESADRIYYFSQAEIDALSSQVDAAKLRRIPLYAMQLRELPEYAPTRPQDILFVGGYNHPPNVDAAAWLVTEILPALREVRPGARVHLVGSNPTEQVLALAGEAVQVHGYLTDAELDALYRQVGAAVVPLRFGAGIKGKVIEAIAHNLPLVTTDIGAEGMPDADSVMWVENTAEAIAARLAEIIGGEAALAKRMERYRGWLDDNFAARHAASALRADMPALARAGARC